MSETWIAALYIAAIPVGIGTGRIVAELAHRKLTSEDVQ